MPNSPLSGNSCKHTGMNPHTPQQKVRRDIRRKRASLTHAFVGQTSSRISRCIATSPLFQQSRHIGCYLAANGEVETAAIIERIWKTGRTCYLPSLVKPHQNRLWFTPFQPDTLLVKNRYGILEPKGAPRQRVSPICLDLVLVPLVAFDGTGHRLGMGGGFYDRTFGFLRHRRHWLKPALLGVAYDFQRINRIPVNPWDVSLSAIATESGFTIFGNRTPSRSNRVYPE